MDIIRIQDQAQLEAAFRIREEVFVKEQGVPLEDEFDAHETVADHVLAFWEGVPVGTGRMRMADRMAKLERICILPAYRKHGLGRWIIGELESIAKEKGLRKAKLHAQKQAQGFYEKLGYACVSEPFMEDGILHVLMVKDLA